MPHCIVDRLEPVEVEKEDADFALFAASLGQGLAQAVEEEGAVRQTGEGIVVGELLNLLFRCLALGDVDDDAEAAADIPLLIIFGNGGEQDMDDFPRFL
jgi:hypothetical protein